jgi:hypothetical protein
MSWILSLIASAAIADFQEQGIAAAAIDEVMAVAPACRETGSHARRQNLLARVRDEHERAFKHIDEFILPAMPVAQR